MTIAERIVVVGGGVGGVASCAALRSGGYVGELVLVDAGEFPYDRPPLSKGFLLGDKDELAIALQRPEWYDEQDVRLIASTVVDRVDADTMTVHTPDGPLAADRIVLAMGGRAARPPIPGADDPRVHVLRDVEDARRLRAALNPTTRALVVGGGLIGAEVASTLVDLGVAVTLVDPVEVPLSAVVGAELAAWMHGAHGLRGIAVRHAGVASLAGDDACVVATLTDGGDPVEADVVVLGVGMVPADELAARAGLDVDRGIVVDEHQQTSRSGIYAVGDVARQRGADGVLARRAEHWEAAQHDAARMAAHVLGKAAAGRGASWFWSDRHGHHIEVVGTFDEASELVWRGEAGDDPFAVFALDGDRMLGAFAVDDSKIVRAARRMIDRGVVVNRAALADPTVDARKLLKG